MGQISAEFNTELHKWLQREFHNPTAQAVESGGGAQDAVLEALMNRWFQGEDTVTSKALQDQLHVSHPTVTAVMKRLESLTFLERTGDRKFHLRLFPRSEFFRWLLQRQVARPTLKFDRTFGEGRPIPQMIERLVKLNLPNVAIGGTVGAAFHYPRLELVGTPRLDLMIAGAPGKVDLGFVQKLDPILDTVADSKWTGKLALHFLGGRPQPWQVLEDGLRYADPLHCMADLHQIGLVSQMHEMLDGLLQRAEANRKKQGR
ncbi:hypothetical protein GCM10027399_11900 [Curvibacter fontanus]